MSTIFGSTAAAAVATQSADPTLALIDKLSAGASTPAAAGTTAKPARPKSEYWLNVGIDVPGIGENGEDVFVSMTGGGIALDDLKPAEVTGNNPKWVQLQQAKNAILALAQQQAGLNEPGGRMILPKLSVEVSRVGKPQQQADANNPFAAAIMAAFQQ